MSSFHPYSPSPSTSSASSSSTTTPLHSHHHVPLHQTASQMLNSPIHIGGAAVANGPVVGGVSSSSSSGNGASMGHASSSSTRGGDSRKNPPIHPHTQQQQHRTSKAATLIQLQLDSPDSLSLIPKLILTYQNQSDLMKTQLLNLYTTQVEDAGVASGIIEDSSLEAASIHSQMREIQSLALETKHLMQYAYPTIHQINDTLENVKMTRDWLQRLLRLQSEVTQLYEVIEREVEILEYSYGEKVEVTPLSEALQATGGITNSDHANSSLDDRYDDFNMDTETSSYNGDDDDALEVDNLLDVQTHLHQLVEFKIKALEELQRNPKELGTFQKFFSFIDDLDKAFQVLIEKYMTILVDIAYEDAPKVVLILRVVYLEEEYESRLHDTFSNEELQHYQKRQLKQLLFSSLKKSIHRQFKKQLKDKETVAGKLEVLSDIPEDIDVIEQYVKPCFPPEYDAMEFFASTYQEEIYKQIHHWMKQIKKLPNGDKLAICKWLKEYPSLMEDCFADYLSEPITYETEFKNLKLDFAHECHEMGYGWLNNIINHTFQDESKISFQRLNDESPVYTAAPLDFFTSLQGLVSSVQDMPDFVVLIVDRIRSLLMSFATRYATEIQEHKTQLEFFTLMAMVNDFNKSMSYIDSFEEVVQESLLLMDEPLDYEMNWLQEVREKYAEEAQRTLRLLLEHIWKTVQEEFPLLFTKSWYQESSTLVICDTLLDFKQDFETGLEPEHCDWLMENLEQLFLASYLDQLLTKRTALKSSAPTIMAQEVEHTRRVFGEDSQAYHALHSLQLIAATQSIEDPSFMDGMSTLLNHFPDFPMHVAENVLSKCSFHSKSLTKDLKECLPMYYRSEPNPDKVSTIFSRYKKRTTSTTGGKDGSGNGSGKDGAKDGHEGGKKGVFKKIFKGSGGKKGPSVNPLPGMLLNPLPLLVDGSPASPAPVAQQDASNIFPGDSEKKRKNSTVNTPEIEQIDLGDILGDSLDLGDLSGLGPHHDEDSETDSDSQEE